VHFDAPADRTSARRRKRRVAGAAALERRSLLIAGHAGSRGLVVATGNLRAFRRVGGLQVADWLADPSSG
jgi:tRNA(fMet)-specific endonuclease VapC